MATIGYQPARDLFEIRQQSNSKIIVKIVAT
jgi:hypothetical protein